MKSWSHEKSILRDSYRLREGSRNSEYNSRVEDTAYPSGEIMAIRVGALRRGEGDGDTPRHRRVPPRQHPVDGNTHSVTAA